MPDTVDTPSEPKLSAVEKAKLASRYLRGTIADVLADPALDHFEEDDKQLLKFHGTYQQYDRDVKKQPGQKGPPPKVWSFMIRLNIPAGMLNAAQWLDLDRIADEQANGTIRLTTRQTIQYHGVVKGDLRPLMQGVKDTLLTSIAACGDVQRNVMACNAPYANEAYRTVQQLARDVTEALKPATGAYFEIWIDGEKKITSDEALQKGRPPEPFYGEQYLPRKFKTGVALDVDNTIDLRAYDCGLIGITEGEGVDRRIIGFNVLAGGGFGMTHNKADTIARLATPIAFVPPQHGVEAVKAVAGVFRDNGNRADRKHARLKYLIEKWGVEKFAAEFRAEFERLTGVAPEPPRDSAPPMQLDYLGVHEQGDGKHFVGTFVRNGRVADFNDGPQYKTAFKRIAKEIGCDCRITAMQSIMFTDLDDAQLERVCAILDEHGVLYRQEDVPHAIRYSMACVALPTCGLALTDSERALPIITDELVEELDKRGLSDVELTVRMTGCPNGCARPYNADIGFVGRKPGRYHVFVGGGLNCDRLAELYAANVPFDKLTAVLVPLFDRFQAERQGDESLSDFYHRLLGRAPEERRAFITGAETPTAELVQISVDV
ncbi:MAG: NADPH-dependent assimilatory sulfite reductase hemoprotein subunit [Planctomycetota bacterium]